VKVSIIFKHADYPDWFHCKPPNDSSGYDNIQRERRKNTVLDTIQPRAFSFVGVKNEGLLRYELSKQYKHTKKKNNKNQIFITLVQISGHCCCWFSSPRLFLLPGPQENSWEA
jgi:hypothetical protein